MSPRITTMLYRTPKLLVLFVCAVAGYIALQIMFFGIFGLEDATSITTPTSLLIQRRLNTRMRNQTQCEIIQVALLSQTVSQSRNVIQLVNSVFVHCQNPVHFHVVCDNTSRQVISTYLNTWDEVNDIWAYRFGQLLSAHMNFYSLPATDIPDGDEKRRALLTLSLLPDSLSRIVYLSSNIRLQSNILRLWLLFDEFLPGQTFGLIKDLTDRNQEKFIYDIMLYMQPTKGVREIDQVFPVPCEWETPLVVRDTAPYCIITKEVHTDMDNPTDTSLPSPCLPPTTAQTFTDKCAPFREAARLKRRTHLYFIGEPYVPSTPDINDVTLATQFTIDRFDVFVQFLDSWSGPAVAVVHVTAAEASQLRQLVDSSPSLRSRQNVAYHVVYKRGPYYPINYLRNVAIKSVTTPYTLFVDVDLVGPRDMYPRIKTAISDYLMNNNKTVFVVAAFGAFKQLSVFPHSRSQLLQLLAEKKVEGYRMSRGWNLGHKPTNYTRWMNAFEPYEAIWKDAFEPYVVVETNKMPEYNIDLLERMGDKIAYARDLHAMGYKFLVLPDLFVVHLPHPVSEGSSLWLRERLYNICSGVIFEEYRARLKRDYPEIKF